MKRTILIMVTAMTMLAGCLVHSRARPHDNRRTRACPPSSYWDSGRCKHKGHKADPKRERGGDDHRRHD